MSSKPRFVGERVKLGDVCTIVSGATPKTKTNEYWGGEIRWVTPAELDGDSHYISDTEKHLTEAGYKSASLRMMPKGTVLLTTRAPIGKVAIAAEEMSCNQGFKNLVCSSAINNEFLYLYLKSRTAELQAMGRGATFKELSKKNVAGFEINLPAIDRQLDAVAKLTAVRSQIALAKQQHDQLDSLVKSRFVEMFGDPVVNPKGWDVSTIKKTAITYGDGPFGSNLKSADYVLSGVRVIRLGNIMRGEFSEKDQSYVSYEKFESLRKYECIPGEVVIATLGDPILRACIVPDFGVPSIHKADCMYYETNKEMVLPVFAMCAINQPSMLQRALLDSHGQTRARINSTQAGNLPMILPPMDLQQEFADFAAQVDKSRFIAQQQIEKLQMLYDSLAQDYFGD